MDWMLLPYRRYFDFSGRSRRREYWLFQLFVLIVTMTLDFGLGGTYSQITHNGFSAASHASPLATGLSGLFGLVNFIPSLAVLVRRLHDIDRSGWWMLIALIPLLGWIVLFVFLCLDGTFGSNRYGEDPKGRGAYDVFR